MNGSIQLGFLCGAGFNDVGRVSDCDECILRNFWINGFWADEWVCSIGLFVWG